MKNKIIITAKQFLDYLKWRIMSDVNFGEEVTLSEIEKRFGTDDISIGENSEIKNENTKKN